jgi:O-antigen/teichoic acid export membrane protein
MTRVGHHRSQNRRLAINFCLLSGGEFIAKLLTFAAFAYLARTLGPGDYGTLEFVLAVMVFFTLPAELGLGSYGAREIARQPDSSVSLFHEIVQVRLLLAFCSFLLLLVFAAFIPKPAEVRLLLVVYGVSLLLGPALLQWLFQAYDLMHWVALASIVRQGIFAALLFAFFHAGTPILVIGVSEVVSVAAVAVYCGLMVRFRLRMPLPRPTLSLHRLRGHFRQGLPIGLTELAWAFMWYFATVVLGFIFHDESLGWFGASHRMLMALHTFVWLYFFNLLPSISRCATGGPDRLRELLGVSMRLVAWASFFCAFLMTVFAREALTFAYGARFEGATHCLAVLMWVLPVAMLSGHYRYTLIACNLQTRLFYCTAVSAGGAVLAGLILVPFFGATGAAAALLLANLATLVLVYRSVRRRVTELPLAEHLARPAAGLAVAILIWLPLSAGNVWVAGIAAAAGYIVVLAVSDGRRLLPTLRTAFTKAPAEQESLVG